jgi:lysophospholipase L1-like esterase
MSAIRPLILAVALALAVPAAADAAKPAPKRYLVSLGDSYATGYQIVAPGRGQGTRNGFAYQVPKLARKRGHRLRLVNFACSGEGTGGETTTTILERTEPCVGAAPGGPDYAGSTQIAAAEAFLRANRRKVGLVTVSIGGNDVTACARVADPVPCVAAAIGRIEQNVGTLAQRLRKAAGRKTPIVGITYPDVILGQWVGADANQDLARLSVVAFRDLINPALAKAYAAAGGKLVDVTAATGAYGSLDELTTLAPYGAIPVPVARVCRLTYYCEFRDIHARTAGYRLIAKLIVRTLPRRG